MSGWVKVMNALRSHPKVLAVSAEACWLYVCGLCWCNEHLTDGVIPEHVLAVIAPNVRQPTKKATELVDARLWHEIEGAYIVHGYLEVQNSAERVADARAKDAERKARQRDRKVDVTP